MNTNWKWRFFNSVRKNLTTFFLTTLTLTTFFLTTLALTTLALTTKYLTTLALTTKYLTTLFLTTFSLTTLALTTFFLTTFDLTTLALTTYFLTTKILDNNFLWQLLIWHKSLLQKILWQNCLWHKCGTATKCSFSTFSWLMYSFTLFTSLFDIKSENLVTDWVVLYKLPNRNSQLYCWKCISSLTEKWAKEAIECKLHEFFLHWALQ